jgi:hypothetical protein
VEELTRRATDAIQIYWGSVQADASPAAFLKEIEVEIPVG